MDRHSIKILLIDDDEDDYLITRDLLSEIEGKRFKLEWVPTYETGLEAIGRNEHDVYLLDYRLGQHNGLELMREAIANGCQMPMILLTGQGDREVDMEAMRTGAADYLVKGEIEAALLERSIRYAIERSQTLEALRQSREHLRHRATELEALAELSSALRTAEVVDEMLPLILQQAIQAVGAAGGAVFLIEPETGDLVLRDLQPFIRGLLGLRFRADQGITGHVTTTDKAYTSQDLEHDPLAQLPPQTAKHLHLAKSIISVPLRTQERIVGVMHIGFPKQHKPTAEEMRLLTSIADIAANALHRAEVLETLELRVVERTRELEEANTRLQELDHLKSKFVTDVSHELRTPVTNIQLYLHLLRRSDPEKHAQYMSILEEQTGQLAVLIQDILNLSHLDMGIVKVEVASVDLNALIQQVIDVQQVRAQTVGLELLFDPDTSLSHVQADPNQLNQIVTNLVDNALNYTSTGWVKVSTQQDLERNQVCIQIQDTGIGIGQEDLSHIFERFYRGEQVGSFNIPGSGLGLSIVKEITSLHGGKVEVKSQLGEGSTFRVWLPLESRDP
jgi:signal transduction histidine kinase/FixJ family two-component response regulator